MVGYFLENEHDFPPSGYTVYNEHGPKLPITPLEALARALERDYSPQDAQIHAELIMRERMTPEKIAQRLKFKQAVEEAVPELSELEQFILTRHFGLDGNIAVTQKRVGNEIGLSNRLVSRIERKALEKVRPYYFSKK